MNKKELKEFYIKLLKYCREQITKDLKNGNYQIYCDIGDYCKEMKILTHDQVVDIYWGNL